MPGQNLFDRYKKRRDTGKLLMLLHSV